MLELQLVSASDESIRAVQLTPPKVFHWVRHLSPEEVREFAAELDGHPDPHRLVVEWRATARIFANPSLTAQLTAPLPDEDHGEVLPP